MHVNQIVISSEGRYSVLIISIFEDLSINLNIGGMFMSVNYTGLLVISKYAWSCWAELFEIIKRYIISRNDVK